MGYNVEESLPSLALYSLLSDDKPVQQQVVAAMKTHMEFMLPDGAWDNSFGSRNYKWSWWAAAPATAAIQDLCSCRSSIRDSAR